MPTVNGGGLGEPAYFFGIGIGNGVYGAKVNNNTEINVNGYGVYNSCGSIVNCAIDNNMFLNTYIGIYFTGADSCGDDGGTNYSNLKENVVINNNFITVSTGGTGIRMAGFEGGNITNLTVENNLVQAGDGAGGVDDLAVSLTKNLTAQNNILDANGGTSLDITTNNVSISEIDNNQTLNGTTLSVPNWGLTNSSTYFIGNGGGLTNITTSSLAGYQTIYFTPTNGAGWYRLYYGGSAVSSSVYIYRTSSGDDESENVEFNFWVSAYATAPNPVGSINQLGGFANGGIVIARIGNLTGESQYAEYLDLYVDGNYSSPFTIVTHDSCTFGVPYFQYPQYVGTTNMPKPYQTLNFSDLGVASTVANLNGLNMVPPGPSGANSTIDFGANFGADAIALYDDGAGDRYGMGINSFELQSFVPSGSHFAWNRGGDLQSSGANELMRLDAATRGLWIGTNSGHATLDVNGSALVHSNLTLLNVPTAPAVTTGGALWVSNSALYWVTPTHTNLLHAP